MLFIPLVLAFVIYWGDYHFMPYVWQGARGIIVAFWMISLLGSIAVWLSMGWSTIEQYRVLVRLQKEEEQINQLEGASA